MDELFAPFSEGKLATGESLETHEITRCHRAACLIPRTITSTLKCG